MTKEKEFVFEQPEEPKPRTDEEEIKAQKKLFGKNFEENLADA